MAGLWMIDSVTSLRRVVYIIWTICFPSDHFPDVTSMGAREVNQSPYIHLISHELVRHKGSGVAHYLSHVSQLHSPGTEELPSRSVRDNLPRERAIHEECMIDTHSTMTNSYQIKQYLPLEMGTSGNTAGLGDPGLRFTRPWALN